MRVNTLAVQLWPAPIHVALTDWPQRRVTRREMNHTALKKDWFVGNALVAFVGVLLIAQYWQRSNDTFELPLNVTVPALPDLTVFVFGSVLFVWSFVLALASIVPVASFRSWVVQLTPSFSIVMWMMTLIAFIASWGSAELPSDQWWSSVLDWGAVGIFLLILWRSVFEPLFGSLFSLLHELYRRFVVSKPRTDAESDDT